jgi:WD40 repeat protein
MHFIKTNLLKIVINLAILTSSSGVVLGMEPQTPNAPLAQLSPSGTLPAATSEKFKQLYIQLAAEDESCKLNPGGTECMFLGQGKLRQLITATEKSETPHASAQFLSLALSKDMQNKIIPQILEDGAIYYLKARCLEKEKILLSGHPNSVKAVMFTHFITNLPNAAPSSERTLVSGSLGHTKNFHYWYLDQIPLLSRSHSIFQSFPAIYSIASSRDKMKFIVTGESLAMMFIVNTKGEEPFTGYPLAIEIGNIITSAAFSPDGNKILLGSNTLANGNIHIADVTTPTGLIQPRLLPARHPGATTSVAWSPDGKYMLSGSRGKEKNLILWEVKTAATARFEYFPYFISNDLEDINTVAFSPDGKMIAFGGKAKEGQPNLFLCDRRNLDIRNLLVTQAANEKFPVLENLPFKPLQGHSQSVFALAFSPDGKSLVSGSSYAEDSQNSLILWDIKNFDKITHIVAPNFPKNVTSVAFSDNDEQIAVGCTGTSDNLFLIKILPDYQTTELKNLNNIEQAYFVNELCLEASKNREPETRLTLAGQEKFSELPHAVKELLRDVLNIEKPLSTPATSEKTSANPKLLEKAPDINIQKETVTQPKTPRENIMEVLAQQRAYEEEKVKRLAAKSDLPEDQPKPENIPDTPGNIFTATFRSIVNWFASGISSLVNWLMRK